MKSGFHRKMVHAVGAFIAYAIFSAVLLVPGDNIIGSAYYIIGAGGMFLSMLWILKHWPGKQMLFAVLLLALIVRVGAIFQFPENSDINRYIWEGEVQLAGYNPYLLAPESEKLKHLRNENWQDINFKHIPAIYWPFAQMVFKAGAAISPTFRFFKTILVFFDLGTIFLLLLLLRPFSSDFREIVLYALNPLTIIAVAGEGHLESILVFWIMLSLYGCRQKKPWLMYPALGLAAMTKLTPIIFLPLLVERDNLKYFPLFLLPFALMLPYVDPGINFLSSFDIFISVYHFNGLFNYFSQVIFGDLPSTWIAMFCAAGLSGFVFFLTPGQASVCFPAVRPFIDIRPDISHLVSAADHPVSGIVPSRSLDHSYMRPFCRLFSFFTPGPPTRYGTANRFCRQLNFCPLSLSASGVSGKIASTGRPCFRPLKASP